MMNSVHAHLHGVRLGLFSNVWMDSGHDGVTDICDVLVATQSINEDSVTWC